MRVKERENRNSYQPATNAMQLNDAITIDIQESLKNIDLAENSRPYQY